MTDTEDQAVPPGEGTDDSNGQQATQQILPAQQTEQAPSTQLEFERMQLLTRFVAGALTSGSGGFMDRLRALEHEYETEADPLSYDDSLEDASTGDLIRYTAMGLIIRTEMGFARGVRTGFYASLGTASWLAEKFSDLPGSGRSGPLRRFVGTRWRQLQQETQSLAREGKVELLQSKRLTGDAVGDIIEDAVDMIADSPELTGYIKDILGGQGSGMAKIVGGNARQLSATGDYVVEGVVRKLLRRTPRKDLPPSPLAGKPQTMYSPETQSWGKENHDE